MQVPKDWSSKRDDLKFDYVQKMVFNRVFSADEKGMRRHGKGRPLFEQPAFMVRPSNPGFFTGQAMKKIIEAQEWEGDVAEDASPDQIGDFQIEEYMDAVAYLQFEILWILSIKEANKKAKESLFNGGRKDEMETV